MNKIKKNNLTRFKICVIMIIETKKEVFKNEQSRKIHKR